MTTEIVVTSCAKCPMNSGKYDQYDNCEHPDAPYDREYKYDQFKGCPLKQSTLTIKIKSDDTPATDTTL